MEIGYVNKSSLLKANIYKSEVLMINDELKLTLDNSRNIFSLNENKDETNNSIVLWSRTKSYIVISDFNLDDLTSTFDDLASITDQTGGWLTFKISGKGCIHLFEKLITINLENFNEGNVIRTSINKINCFLLCKNKYNTYYIICPISYYKSMTERLTNLCRLIEN